MGLSLALAVGSVGSIQLPANATAAAAGAPVPRAYPSPVSVGLESLIPRLRPPSVPLQQVSPSSASVVPLVDSEWLIIVFRDQQRITLYRHGEPVKSYAVSTGKPETVTPLGWWKIVEKRTVSPAGIYGTRWLGWERWNPRTGRYEWYSESPPFGIHGTNEPEKIGSAVSSGCVRLRNADVEELYDLIPSGTYVLVLE